MEIAEKTMFLVDENGEVINEVPRGKMFTYLDEGDRVFRRDRIDEIDRMSPVNMRFGKINLTDAAIIGHKYPIFLDLMKYVQYGTGKLVFRNGLPVSRDSFPRICNVSSHTIDRQLKGLMKDDVIKAVRNGKNKIYYMNPYILHLGQKIRNALVDLFKDTFYINTCEKMWDGDKK